MNAEEVGILFTRIGKRLFGEHLVGGNFGNLSVLDGRWYFITHTGAYLDADPMDLVVMPINGRETPGASSEWKVHTAVYNATDHRAIVHAHPSFAVAMSLIYDCINTVDSDGQRFAPKIEVVEGACGSQDLAEAVADVLAHAHVVIAKGHGTFAAGNTLDEAYLYTSLAEHCCKVKYLTDLSEKGILNSSEL